MAVKFSSSFGTLFTQGVWWMFGSGASRGVTVYSGSIPSNTSMVINNWINYNRNSSLTLWHASTGCTLEILGSNIINASNVPTSVNPLRTGAASWFILWNANNVDIDVATIPTTSFMIGDVSSLFGTGIMKFVNNSLDSTVPTTFSEMNFKITYVG